QNLEAYEAFLRGEQATQGLGNRDPRALEAGLVHYQKAVALDSSFAKAWAAIAFIQASFFRNNPSAILDTSAKDAVDRVRRLAPGSTDAHRVTAIYYRNVKKELRA